MLNFFDNINKKTLKNGLDYIVVDIPDKLDCTIYLTVLTGSKNEDNNNNGISHFLEHLIYKGNKKYPTAQDLLSKINELGADYNGLTNRDSTSYYFTVYYKNFKKIMEMMSYMIFTSFFKNKDIIMERKVVLQEIQKDLDNQYSLLDDLIYQIITDESNPYNKTIAGTSDSLNKINRKSIIDYYNTYYIPSNMKISIAGNVPKNIDKLMEKYFGKMFLNNIDKKIIKNPNLYNFNPKFDFNVTNLISEQLYMALTFKIFGKNDINSYKLEILNIYLNIELTKLLREENGLTYNVSSYYFFFKEFGEFQIILNFDANKLNKCLDLIFQTIEKIKKNKINKKNLQKIKNNIKSSSMLYIDNTYNIAEYYKEELFYLENEEKGEKKKIVTFGEKIKMYIDVDEEFIMNIANDIFNYDILKISFVGDINKNSIKKCLSKNKYLKKYF
jgi:predicted Zn-dependent peptidase